MPRKPKRPCRYPGCPNLTDDGLYCEAHRKKVQTAYERYRGSAKERGYDARWRKARTVFLHQHPLCAACLKENRVTPATVVDHITPHRGDKTLFWDTSNWQPLCETCHNKKTASEDGGFGNGQ